MRRQRRRPSLAPPGPPRSSTQAGAFTSAADVPIASTHRLVVMLQYVTPLAFILPDDHREGAQFKHMASDAHDEVTRLVLGVQ